MATSPIISGAGIIGELLRTHAALTAHVPVAHIKRGRLADDAALPTLVVAEVSQIERQTLKRGALVRTVDRVSVTGRFESDRQRAEIMQMVKDACAGWRGDMGALSSISVLTAGRGPDLNGPGNSFEKTQDFKVGYDAPAGGRQ